MNVDGTDAGLDAAVGRPGLLSVLLVGLLAFAFAATAAAQSPPSPPSSGFPLERPADRLSEDPLPAPLAEENPSLLPPVPEPSLAEIQGEDPLVGIEVRSIEFRGNRAIDSLTLGRAAEPFLGKRLSAEGFEALRRRLTEVYVAAGYVNSGAVIPPQSPIDGRLVIAILEGQVAEVRVRGLRYYRQGVIQERLRSRIGSPLDIHEIEREIRVLNQDPRIDRITAQLRPGDRRDQAILELDIVEANPYTINLRFDNEESPSVGAYTGRVSLSHLNYLGLGDQLRVNFLRSEGLTRIRADYTLPVNSHGTSLLFEARLGFAKLVDNLARNFGIESTDASFSVGLTQKVWHDPKNRMDVSLFFERSRSKTELDGRGFSFVDGPQSGRSEVSAVRILAEWSRRNTNSVFAIRGLLSWGTDWFNPTTQPGNTPDGEFLSFYTQGRGIYRFPRSGIEIRLRGDLQVADDPLLSLEQFAIGGPGSVRGVRRNRLVRDQGFSTSLDVRFPLIRSADAQTVVALSPTYDIGYAWNRSRATPPLRTLSSIGAKLEWFPHPRIDLGIEYAHGLRDLSRGNDLQDQSVYLFVEWRAF